MTPASKHNRFHQINSLSPLTGSDTHAIAKRKAREKCHVGTKIKAAFNPVSLIEGTHSKMSIIIIIIINVNL